MSTTWHKGFLLGGVAVVLTALALTWREPSKGRDGEGKQVSAAADTIRQTPRASSSPEPVDPTALHPPATAWMLEEKAGSVLQPPSEPAVQEFRRWVKQFLEEDDPREKRALVDSGRKLALAHRETLKVLIPTNPRKALQQALPMVLRQQLPAEVASELEVRINTRGYYRVYAALGTEAEHIRRFVETGSKRYKAYVYGRRLNQPTTPEAFLSGIAVDNLMAVDERPLRVLEPGERPDPSFPMIQTCPVSGESTPLPWKEDNLRPVGGTTPAVQAGGTTYYLRSGGHIVAFEQQLIAREGGTGGPVYPLYPIPTSSSKGVRSVLYLRLTFPDTGRELLSEAAAHGVMQQVNDWFAQSSYGKLYLLTTVSPLIFLPRTENWYQREGDEFDLRDDAIAVAKQQGYDADQYDHVIFAYSGGPGTFQGSADVLGRHVWLRNTAVRTAAHELAHNFGLWHANFWDTDGLSTIGPGSNEEYGNDYDTMGTASPVNGHFNAGLKHQIGWLENKFVHDIRQSGIYRIFAFDQPKLDPIRRYAFRVRKDAQRVYWAEFRERYTSSNLWMRDGILLNWSPWSESVGGSHLLDMTPGSPGEKEDAALTIGRTFSDFEAAVHITPIAKAGSSPESIDVVVNLGPFPENRPPTLALSASQTSVNSGVPVQLEATATDPDADLLSFFWDFGDGTFSPNNSPLAHKSWNGDGRYVVRCVVSDMKGGTASASALVTVGTPTTFTISGRITRAGADPITGVHVHNGKNGAEYRGAHTDSDGTYTIAGLDTGNVNLNAGLLGFSFTPAFANPVSVGPDFSGADFTAQEVVLVSITATDPTATEGGDPGTITLARTGPTTASLVVAVAEIRYTAHYPTDFTLTPEPYFDSGLRSVAYSIPAGQSSITLTIQATSDSLVEGPETVTVEIRSAGAYLVSGSKSATVTILDGGGESLPLVRVDAVDPDASEAGDDGTFSVSRLGSTANNLTVFFEVSGNAVNGTDYATIGTSIIIQAGQATANLTISPINDAETEGEEEVLLILSPRPTYLIAPEASQASVFIVDDDVPTVSIVAMDPTASEVGPDPATFVVTRTGDVNLPITVNYAIAGSAHHGVDYFPLPGILTIPAGATAASITVVPIDDSIGEPAQTVLIQLSGGSQYVVGEPAHATATIVDNDLPVVTIGISDGTLGEPSDAGQIRFTTTGTGSGNITVRYTVAGTATPDVDYIALPGTRTMGRNTSATLTVTPLDDDEAEDRETIIVTLEPDPTYTRFLDQSVTLNLTDNEHNMVDVSVGNAPVRENSGGALLFYLSRQGPTTSSLTVYYEMSGTAVMGADYQQLSGTATMAAGRSGVTVTANVIDDALVEGTETVTLTLLADPAYGQGRASATHHLLDDENPPITVRFASSTGSGNENVGLVNIPVTLSAAATEVVTVEYAVKGGSATGGIDYDLAPGILTFQPGVTSAHIPLIILDDPFPETTQTVIIELRNAWRASLGTSTHTFSITDDDSLPPVLVGFAATASAGGESLSPAMVAVSLTATQMVPVSVNYAPTGGSATGGGVDYTLAPGTLTFAPGETVKWIGIPIVDDTINEANETIILTLSSPTGAALGANSTHAYTINNLAGTLAVSPAPGLSSTGLQGGPFAPNNMAYTLRNIGDTSLNWTATASDPWLELSIENGTLAPDTFIEVVVALSSDSESLMPQNHHATVMFVNVSNHNGDTNRAVSLNVMLAAPLMAPEPPFTADANNIVSWNALAGAEFYEVQRSTNEDFLEPSSSGWITSTSHDFTELMDCTAYYYRVRAWRTSAKPPAGPWSATVASTQDATPPVIDCASNLVIQTSQPSGAIATFLASASDSCNPDPSVACDPPSGSLFPLGTTTVHCQADDAANNSVVCSFTVTVTDSGNSPPVPASPILPRQFGRNAKIRVTDLLGVDPDEDPVTLSAIDAQSAQGGTVTRDDIWVYYTPPEQLNTEDDSFGYTVSDGRGGFGPGLVTVVVVTNLGPSLTLSWDDLDDGSVLITGNGIAGWSYTVEFTEDLEDPEWSALETVVADLLGAITYADHPPLSSAMRFYRLAFY